MDRITTKLELIFVLGKQKNKRLLLKRHSDIIELPRGKTNNVVSEQVGHKVACTSTEKS